MGALHFYTHALPHLPLPYFFSVDSKRARVFSLFFSPPPFAIELFFFIFSPLPWMLAAAPLPGSSLLPLPHPPGSGYLARLSRGVSGFFFFSPLPCALWRAQSVTLLRQDWDLPSLSGRASLNTTSLGP